MTTENGTHLDPLGEMPDDEGEEQESVYDEQVRLPEQRVQPGRGTLIVDVKLPPGYKVHDESPSSVTWKVDDPNVVELPDRNPNVPLTGRVFPVPVDVTLRQGHTILEAELSLHYCQTNGAGLCVLEFSDIQIPVTVTTDAPGREIWLEMEVHAPENARE
ncbi:MAG: hypothetical protein GX552_06150 [Chloroflexi bacterium]|nr:hypothetical protein [Chloroflexota bacterium]